MARHVSRPAALRVTWVVHPWGISAHAMTIAALSCAIAAAIAFGRGDVPGWLAGAALLQVWYLLDHVDGQIARLHGAASLDGMQLDYLMHHVVNLVIPWGMGFGLMQATGSAAWMVAGLAWSLGLLLLGLVNDARYKAFIGRLKQLDRPLMVVVSEKPKSSFAPGKNVLVSIIHTTRKLCEVHVVMNSLTAIAVVQFFIGSILPGEWYLACAAPVALATAVATLARDVYRGAAEREFAQWYRVPDDAVKSLLPVAGAEAGRMPA